MEMEQRLSTARRKVRLATHQAYSALVSSNETILWRDPTGNGNGGNDDGGNDSAVDNDSCGGGGGNDSADDNDNYGAGEDDSNDNDEATRRAKAMDLGLSLFGGSNQNQLLEEEWNARLRSVEEELYSIQSGLGALEKNDGGGGGGGGSGGSGIGREGYNSIRKSAMPGEDDGDYSMDYVVDGDDDGYEKEDNDVEQLRVHITFLQQCSQAKKLLDHVDTLAMQTNFATSTVFEKEVSREGGVATDNDCSSIYSPTSICSPSEFTHFAFDSPSTTTAMNEKEGGAVSPLVRATQMVAQAEEILGEITALLKTQHNQGQQGQKFDKGGVESGMDKENTHNFSKEAIDINKKNDKMAQMQRCMLSELHQNVRSKKTESKHRATSLVEGCVVFLKEESALLVRGSGTTGGNRSAGFDLESPMATTTPRLNESGNNGTNTNNDGATLSSPLGDAYQVLQLFSDTQYPTFGDTLDGSMKKLSKKIMDVLKPCLNEVEGQGGESTGNAGNKRHDKKEMREMRYYKFTQDVVKKSSLGSGVRGVAANDRRYDPVTVKGPAVRLQWTLNCVALDDNKDGTQAADTTDRSSGPASTIATAETINENALRSLHASSTTSSSSCSIATYLSMLNYTCNLLSFIHEHILLGQQNLAAMLGAHLFGIHPLKETSLSFGSAIMSGFTLLGTVAHGVQEGEDMPLMSLLVEAMKRCCVPRENGREVWGRLNMIEMRLTKEVGEFESNMAEMGLMSMANEDKAMMATSAQDVLKSPGVTSPTGLSVLVDSPIESNEEDATLSNLSTILDSSFPTSTSHQQQQQLKKKERILSPLSSLATSLHNLYTQNLRSQILNRGRSILLNTDYHNTVQVGTFVKEPSEIGSLASLDDDPLSVFKFQECSVSIVAKSILELVRGTLDEATDSELYPIVDDYQSGDNSGNSGGGGDSGGGGAVKEWDALPPMLYRASRELFDLFRAIIPTMHASEVGSIPRMAAVLHNDCEYLAYECGLLGAEYKAKFRSLTLNTPDKQSSKTRLLGECCSFLDMVPPFRDLATKSMGSMIELQKGQIYELVNPRLANFQNALRSNESVSEWDDADTALRAALYHLRHLSQAWKPVLSRGVYHMSMGNLIDMVLTLFIDPVLKAEAITESASRFVHSLFLDAARGASEMFLVGETAIPAATASAQGFLAKETSSSADAMQQQQRCEMAKKYTALFDKSQAVGQFMCMRLDEIRRGLEDGVFRSVTARELSHLISAAFDDSEKRRALLNDLANRH